MEVGSITELPGERGRCGEGVLPHGALLLLPPFVREGFKDMLKDNAALLLVDVGRIGSRE